MKKIIFLLLTFYCSNVVFSRDHDEMIGIINGINNNMKIRNLRVHIAPRHLSVVNPRNLILTGVLPPSSYFETPDIRIVSGYIERALFYVLSDPIPAGTRLKHHHHNDSISVTCDLGLTGDLLSPFLGVETLNVPHVAHQVNKIKIIVKQDLTSGEWFFATAMPVRK